MIDPSIWQDEEFGSLSSNAKVLFIGLFSNADDEGRIRANPSYLKSTVFMYDEEVDVTLIPGIREEVIYKMKAVQFYEVDGKEYIQLKNWDEYQKQHKDRVQPSTLPTPSNDVSDNVGQMPTQDKLSKDKLVSGKSPEIKIENVETFAKGSVGGLLAKKYPSAPQTPLPSKITFAWQDKALRYAEALKIDLNAVINEQSVRPRWFKAFKQAEEGRKTSNIEKAYGYLADHEAFQSMGTEAKLNFFFSIYENGLQKNFN